MTKSQFSELLDQLAESVGLDMETWENHHKKTLYFPQLVSMLIEILWLEKVENAAVELLRQQYRALRTNGVFDFEE